MKQPPDPRHRSAEAPPIIALRTGQFVELSGECPLDFEGTGPLPGATGLVTNVAVDAMGTWATVRFKGHPGAWKIPAQHLSIIRP